MTDNLILVDFHDRPIGQCEKLPAHRQPRLHRAFSVFLYRSTPAGVEMLLQRRAEGKYHSGGLWTNACCSHPRVGEELQEAVDRRLLEELGVRAPVRELFSFIYYHRFSPEIAEYELDHVFLGEYDGPLSPAPEEIDNLSWVSLASLSRRMLEEPDAFTPWFMTAAPRVIRTLEEALPGL